MRHTTTSPAAPYVVFGSIISMQLIYLAYHSAVRLGTVVALFAVGILVWSLVEYLLHRFAFHSSSDHILMKPFNSTLHLWHHDAPTSLDYVAAPMSLGIPVYFLIVGGAYLLIRDLEQVLWMGTAAALTYLFYEAVHFMAHRTRVKNPVLKYLKRYHLQHHFVDKNSYFGVTSPFWDIVFRTKPSSVRSREESVRASSQ